MGRGGRENKGTHNQGTKERVAGLGGEARSQDFGRGESGSVPRRAGFCILERIKRAKRTLEFKLHWKPLLPPCLYSVGASRNKKR
jgi:hypothetical protein